MSKALGAKSALNKKLYVERVFPGASQTEVVVRPADDYEPDNEIVTVKSVSNVSIISRSFEGLTPLERAVALGVATPISAVQLRDCERVAVTGFPDGGRSYQTATHFGKVISSSNGYRTTVALRSEDGKVHNLQIDPGQCYDMSKVTFSEHDSSCGLGAQVAARAKKTPPVVTSIESAPALSTTQLVPSMNR